MHIFFNPIYPYDIKAISLFFVFHIKCARQKANQLYCKIKYLIYIDKSKYQF